MIRITEKCREAAASLGVALKRGQDNQDYDPGPRCLRKSQERLLAAADEIERLRGALIAIAECRPFVWLFDRGIAPTPVMYDDRVRLVATEVLREN